MAGDYFYCCCYYYYYYCYYSNVVLVSTIVDLQLRGTHYNTANNRGY